MPIVFEFVGDILHLRAIGAYPLAELEATLHAALALPDRPRLRGALFDVRESAVVGTRTTPQVRATAEVVASVAHQFDARVALLATSDLAYGVMRMLAAWADSTMLDVAVFRDEVEARSWVSR
ncbi:MAG: hypothetical protein HOQ30_13350 [Gemmatimonadaceae bacterium]|nr:hypothetical protein [Gemmatimonadaceae bacterium]NUQ94834.1 hypothetical protein [Gemmatimonadaceae bacterium]NUR34990.1 hypothetical protein [Gemmatimonadaceae bacterium]